MISPQACDLLPTKLGWDSVPSNRLAAIRTEKAIRQSLGQNSPIRIARWFASRLSPPMFRMPIST